jgi:aminopeptidase YwaD
MTSYGISGERAYDLLVQLGPARMGGSPREHEAATVLIEEIRELGLQPLEERCVVWTFADDHAELEVLSPFQASIPCKAAGLSGSTPPDGIEAPLVFVENGAPMHLANVRDKIVLMSGRWNAPKYERMVRNGALGFVCIGDPAQRQPLLNILEIEWVQKSGKRPGVFISFDDGVRLLQEHANRIRLQVTQREYEDYSSNVAVEIPGMQYPDEIILVGAHYDSHRDMDGAHDNGGGTVAVMEMLRYFAHRPALRTLRFVFFGSEELGSRGSLAYAEQHAAELEKFIFMVILDLGGGIIGQDAVDVFGPPELRTFFDLWDREEGLGLDIRNKVAGSDDTSFLHAGIPGVSIFRREGTCARLHTPDDSLVYIDAGHLAHLAELSVKFLDRVANAYRFPFKREVPESIQREHLQKQELHYGWPGGTRPLRTSELG